MEIADVRRRVRQALDRARQRARERRALVDAATRDYERFLTGIARPVLAMCASALTAEGIRCELATPQGVIRIVSQSHPRDFVELTLDATRDVPAVIARVSVNRGGNVVTTERPLQPNTPICKLTEEDVLNTLLAELDGFLR